MAPVVLRGGATVDLLSAAELGAELDLRFGSEGSTSRQSWWQEQQDIEEARERERFRAVKLLRRDAALTAPALTRLTTLDSITPESSYIWVVLLVAAQLASSGSFQAFITSDTDTTRTSASQRRLVASTSTNNQYPALPIPKNACILLPGEGLFLNASANIVSYFLSGWMLPEVMQGKLL